MFIVGKLSGLKFDSLSLRQKRNFGHNLIVTRRPLSYWIFHVSYPRKTHCRGYCLRGFRSLYGVETAVQIEQPKQSSFGELALPAAFQLARQLKKAPKAIAAEIAAAGGAIEGVSSMEIAGNGYLNVRLDRGAYGAGVLMGEGAVREGNRD